jgi:predicted neuraminidase
MIYTVFFGDGGRGVVELEANTYRVTAEGALLVLAEDGSTICTWAPGAWRSAIDNAAFKAALKAGTPDENPGRRQTPRTLSQV